jgi:hypothetical protein
VSECVNVLGVVVEVDKTTHEPAPPLLHSRETLLIVAPKLFIV